MKPATLANTRRWFVASAWMVGALFSVSSWANDGEVIFVIGEAHLLATGGGAQALSKGSAVNTGDIIMTTSKGQVQIRMSDGGMISVRPNSHFKIADYKYTGGADDSSKFELIKGGFRSITGLIGKANKKAYLVKSPVATIGIRGTDYSAQYCNNDCTDASNGLYLGVYSGGVIVDNGVGAIDINPGQYGFVPDTVSVPMLLDNAPGTVLFASASNSGSTNTATSTRSTSDNSSPATASSGVDSSGNIASLDSGVVTSVVTNTVSPTPVTTLAVANSNTVLVGDATVMPASNTVQGSANGISWGIIPMGATVGTTTLASDSPWIMGTLDDSKALATTGTFTYTNFVVGLAPTDVLSTAGTISSSSTTGTLITTSLGVDFGKPTDQVSLALQIDTTGEQWTANGNGTISNGQFSGALSGGINGSAVPGASGSSSGTFAGGFAGATDSAGIPAGAFVGYNLTGTYDNGSAFVTRTWVGTVAYTK